MKTHALMDNLLDTSKLLRKYNSKNPPTYIEHRDLDPMVGALRRRLRESVKTRVFNRYAYINFHVLCE